MKKYLLIIPMLLAVVPVLADGRSEEVLAKLDKKIASLGDYNVAFEVSAEGNYIDGVYAVSGHRYFMKTDEYEVICDGKVRYEVNHEEEEVLVDNVNPQDRNIMSNPTRAFEFASDVFSSTYKGEESVKGSLCDVVELVPLDNKNALKRITLKVNRASGLPTEVRYLSEGLSEDVVVDIRKIGQGLFDGVVFKFDKASYKGYEIVDFR